MLSVFNHKTGSRICLPRHRRLVETAVFVFLEVNTVLFQVQHAVTGRKGHNFDKVLIADESAGPHHVFKKLLGRIALILSA
jgi:hypothetical protein